MYAPRSDGGPFLIYYLSIDRVAKVRSDQLVRRWSSRIKEGIVLYANLLLSLHILPTDVS